MKFLFFIFAITAAFCNTSDSLSELKKGNERFVQNETHATKHLVQSQSPIATILTCSDSRVSPSLIFDQGLGKLFVIRVAGNIADQMGIASIEYGVHYLKTPLLVILGHQHCGAVKASFDLGKTDFSANIAALLEEIQPAVTKVKKLYPNKNQEELLESAIIENVKLVSQKILDESPLIRQYLKDGKLTIVKGNYNIETKRVDWIK
jgi:carbonic anhydrase